MAGEYVAECMWVARMGGRADRSVRLGGTSASPGTQLALRLTPEVCRLGSLVRSWELDAKPDAAVLRGLALEVLAHMPGEGWTLADEPSLPPGHYWENGAWKKKPSALPFEPAAFELRLSAESGSVPYILALGAEDPDRPGAWQPAGAKLYAVVQPKVD